MTETTATQAFPYLSYAHISVAEKEEENVQGDEDYVVTIPAYWVATFSGHSYQKTYGSLSQPGPDVELSRVGQTADDAIAAVTEALTQQGWEFR